MTLSKFFTTSILTSAMGVSLLTSTTVLADDGPIIPESVQAEQRQIQQLKTQNQTHTSSYDGTSTQQKKQEKKQYKKQQGKGSP